MGEGQYADGKAVRRRRFISLARDSVHRKRTHRALGFHRAHVVLERAYLSGHLSRTVSETAMPVGASARSLRRSLSSP
jgi:hypothetical protein